MPPLDLMAIASLELSGMLRVKPHMIFRLIHQSLTVLGVSLNFVSDEGGRDSEYF